MLIKYISEEATMFCATVIYPGKEGETLDFEHYAEVLAPMYAHFLGTNCVGYEVRKGLVTPGEPRARFACIISYWLTSREEYGKSLENPQMNEVMKQFSFFSDSQPIRQFDKVIRREF